MKKFVAASLVFVLTLLFGMVGSALAQDLSCGDNNGIGCLASTTVYRVNVIAYDKCPKSDKAQRIAVLANFEDDPVGDTLVTLDRRNKIFLVGDTDFRVLDSNACDDDGALLQLPADVSAIYSLWVRLVGPPDSSIDVKTCALDTTTNTIVCGDSFVKVRNKGDRPTFTNATSKLLHLLGKNLFDPMYEDYFWSWNTQGKPHAQLWFADENGG
jgi:hypothetical protein